MRRLAPLNINAGVGAMAKILIGIGIGVVTGLVIGAAWLAWYFRDVYK